MEKSSFHKKYSLSDIAKYLNLSAKITNGIRKHFGDPISLYELKQISEKEFRSCPNFGLISWREFEEAMLKIKIPEKRACKIISRQSKKITLEIDVSKPFEEVIKELSQIISNTV